MSTLFQNQFVVDDVSKIIKEAIEQTIGGNAYQHDKVNNWTGSGRLTLEEHQDALSNG